MFGDYKQNNWESDKEFADRVRRDKEYREWQRHEMYKQDYKYNQGYQKNDDDNDGNKGGIIAGGLALLAWILGG